jgi:ribonuclease E
VNSGRATKEGSIEDTAVKTNLEAAEEIARQLRLRDLAGLIVIDFIDMEERRNNAAVEKKLKDKLKTDRARIQVGRISGFGLMEMSRQRLRPGMLESTTQPCSHCHGTGLIRSDDSLGLQVLRALEEEGTRKRSKEVLLKAPIGIVNFLINQKREHIALIEARYGMSVRIECDPSLISPDYSIEKFKTATRVVPEISSVISGNASLMGAPVAEEEEDDFVEEDILDEVEEAEEVAEVAEKPAAAAAAADGGNGQGKKKRRRRRRRKGPAGANGAADAATASDEDGDAEGDDDDTEAGDAPAEPVAAEPEAAPEADQPAPKKRTRTRGGKAKVAKPEAEVVAEAAPVEVEAATEAPAEAVVAEAKPKSRSRKPKAPVEGAADEAAAEPAAKPARSRSRGGKAKAEAAAEPVVAEAPVAETPVVETPVVEAAVVATPSFPVDPAVEVTNAAAPVAAAPEADAPEEDGPSKPKRKGWWSLGR